MQQVTQNMYGENFDKELNGKLEKITIDFEDIKYS